MINDEIVASTVRVFDENGEMLGVMKLSDAKYKAKTKSMDLICINPNQDIPICKIYDYGKYQFEQKKKQKETKQKKIVLKEVQLRVNIGEHDMETKAKQVQKFLDDGNRVKIGIYMSGREINNAPVARATFEKFLELIPKYAVEVPIQQSVSNIIIQIKGA